MFSDKIALTIQELLVPTGVPVYYIDQIPSYDQAKNPNGFIGWDIDQLTPMHSTEGIEYATDIVLNFELTVTVYDGRMAVRNNIEMAVLDILQPRVNSKRKPLLQKQLTNAFIRFIVWTNVVEFPIPKTGQANAEMSASVLLFSSSISVKE